ncbi:hypothetical protein SYJ56_10165 [Algoriphagus sp. D3-2-R+10]|uniref:hypothetical protein n=1 Tax=Algoriphagus aurantiacus TaxID=3103948 RepID=UPI002B375B0F|nr:hypothetical protein [Algoriphagus sp. D3-2-R+10]MEB2775672.1 hypothetical protein [Algoriphagus sp. D3-2-R+10]
MKKLLFGMAFMGAIMCAGFEVGASVPYPGGDEGPCKDKVIRDGELITTIVCNRKTTLGGAMIGAHCTKVATTSCSFTNM